MCRVNRCRTGTTGACRARPPRGPSTPVRSVAASLGTRNSAGSAAAPRSTSSRRRHDRQTVSPSGTPLALRCRPDRPTAGARSHTVTQVRNGRHLSAICAARVVGLVVDPVSSPGRVPRPALLGSEHIRVARTPGSRSARCRTGRCRAAAGARPSPPPASSAVSRSAASRPAAPPRRWRAVEGPGRPAARAAVDLEQPARRRAPRRPLRPRRDRPSRRAPRPAWSAGDPLGSAARRALIIDQTAASYGGVQSAGRKPGAGAYIGASTGSAPAEVGVRLPRLVDRDHPGHLAAAARRSVGQPAASASTPGRPCRAHPLLAALPRPVARVAVDAERQPHHPVEAFARRDDRSPSGPPRAGRTDRGSQR